MARKPLSSPGEARAFFRPPHKLRWRIDFEPVAIAGERRSATAMRSDRVRARTVGISIGGAFIETTHLVDVGTPLALWLHPSDAKTLTHGVLRLHAEVRWQNDGTRRDLPRGFGVAFRALTATDELRLLSCFSGLTPPAQQ